MICLGWWHGTARFVWKAGSESHGEARSDLCGEAGSAVCTGREGRHRAAVGLRLAESRIGLPSSAPVL